MPTASPNSPSAASTLPLPQPSSSRRTRRAGSARRKLARMTASRPRNHQCDRSSSMWTATYAGSIALSAEGRHASRETCGVSPMSTEEPAEAVETLLDALQRRRVGEPQVALGVGAKGGAGRDGHVDRLEQLAGETDR